MFIDLLLNRFLNFADQNVINILKLNTIQGKLNGLKLIEKLMVSL